MTKPAPRITVPEFERLCLEQTPFNELYGFVTEAIGYGSARVRMPANPKFLRPGGTISGPAQMALADFAMYAAVLGAVGNVPMAVTTNLAITFLNKPEPGDLVCDVRLLKIGKRLVMGDAIIHSVGRGEPVSHVTLTYSVPPDRAA
jgi:acyl-coenzyme A thioesterase PaaI-like protein